MLVPFSNTAIVSNDANDANDANSFRCVQMHRKRILISLLLLYSITKSNRTRRLDIYENLLLLLLMYIITINVSSYRFKYNYVILEVSTLLEE